MTVNREFLRGKIKEKDLGEVSPEMFEVLVAAAE